MSNDFDPSELPKLKKREEKELIRRFERQLRQVEKAGPRVLPVNMPLPHSGFFTVAVIDSDGNIVLKVDQSESPFAAQSSDR